MPCYDERIRRDAAINSLAVDRVEGYLCEALKEIPINERKQFFIKHPEILIWLIKHIEKEGDG